MKNLTKLTFFLLLGSIACIAAPTKTSAQTISHPSVNNVITGDLMHAASGTNFLGVVYANGGEVYYNQLATNGIWGNAQLLGTGSEARMDIDANDRVHVVFTSSGKIAYMKLALGEWSEPEFIESNFAGSCSKPDIASDSDSNGHITYTDTRGNTGDYTDHPDIMYATNASGSFVNTLIHNGYYQYYGSRYGEYFEKGSFITVDENNNYYLLSHKRIYENWGFGIDHNHYLMIHSNLGTGSIYGSSSNATSPFDIYDLSTNGEDVIALFRHSGMKTAKFSLTESNFSFTDEHALSATSVSSVALTATNMVTGGRNSMNLFTNHNALAHTYGDIVVKGAIVSTANIGEVFYALYTDNGDGFIKVREVATPLSITSFEFAQQTGQAFIDGTTNSIEIEVANGTDLSSLIASFVTTSDVTDVQAEGVLQVSGTTVNDFTTSVLYTLGDGETARNWSITVTEEPVEYAISTVSNPVEGGATSGEGDYVEGALVTVTAIAEEGFRFKQWQEDGEVVSTEAEYHFIAEANRDLLALFIEQYTLTLEVVGNGTVAVNDVLYTEMLTADSGTELNLQAIAGDEYHFTGWSGHVISTENPLMVTLNEHMTITSNYSFATNLKPAVMNGPLVFPNPAKEDIYFSHVSDIKRIILYNISGNKVMDEILKGRQKLTIGHLQSGYYLLYFELVNGKIMVEKILKQ